MTTDPTVETKIRKLLAYAMWVWLIGSVVAVLSAAAAAVATAMTDPDAQTPAIVLAVGNVIMAAIAIPAALALRRRANWARITLYVMSLLCIGAIVQAMKIEAWPSVVINLILSGPIGVLAEKDVKAACKASRATASRPD